MEEKKEIKISLSTFFLILALIIVIVMGMYIYKLYNEKTEETKKTEELQSQVNSLNGTISDLKGKLNIISETINSTDNNNEDSKNESLKNDYSKYIGIWTDNKANEFTVRNIGDDFVTFTWFIYRTATIEDVTLPFRDNKAVFYYEGYDDLNFNSMYEDDEYYCRKAIIELKESSIAIEVENCTNGELKENSSLDKTDLFNGGVYIKPGEYTYSIKK